MEAYVIDWLNLGLRWLHFVAGVAWIGASLYFVMLDLSLQSPNKPEDAKRGVHGELWAVHGGGFYQSQKFLAGPKGEPLSENLHWSKWEAYTTWLSGMGLMAIIYWYGATAFLIDRSTMELSAPAAIAISAGSLVAGWLVYDALCKAVRHELTLSIIMYALLVAAAWGYGQVFGARAAYVHAGALIGTIMVWNVFFHIIPGQTKMVNAIRAGRGPEPRYGIVGKQRSVHNTYFTLPVLFIMISGHYPMTYGHKHAWAVLAVVMLAGALIRQYFVLRHTGRKMVALPAAAAALLLGLAVAIAPASAPQAPGAAPLAYSSVQPIIAQRCIVCHAEKPSFAGFSQPPGGLKLETPAQVRAAAQRIQQQSIATRAMPIGNITNMTEEERSLLGRWLAAGARTD
ncbi:MAG: urate hydroxylase PuuD [Betaproteobacteria bacterium]|nr:urate hydroxylase PuuD [Betaproteobacteria bacterium]